MLFRKKEVEEPMMFLPMTGLFNPTGRFMLTKQDRRAMKKYILHDRTVKLVLAGTGALVALKAASYVTDRVHEERQNRKLKKLQKRVDELSERVEKLEKENR